jgi:hypothetical protein
MDKKKNIHTHTHIKLKLAKVFYSFKKKFDTTFVIEGD